jgi:Lon protease (S16) C-terminal proteolytic domain
MKAIHTHRVLLLAVVWGGVGLAEAQVVTRAIGPWRIGMTLDELKVGGMQVDEDKKTSSERHARYLIESPVPVYGVDWQVELVFGGGELAAVQLTSERTDEEDLILQMAKKLVSGIIQEAGLPREEDCLTAVQATLERIISKEEGEYFSIPGDERLGIAIKRTTYANKRSPFYYLQVNLMGPETRVPSPLKLPEASSTTPLEPAPDLWTLELPGSKDAVFKRSLSSINALLVSPLEGAGNASTAMKLSATAIGGTAPDSIKFSFNQAVGEDMQKASDEVVRAVQVRHGQYPASMDVKFGFGDKWGGKDGPSAAVACALLLESLIGGFDIPSNFAVTGDLNADSTVQPVGGVADKVRGAMDLKCELIGVPIGNEEDLMDLVVEENLRRFLSAKVFTLRQLDEAVILANPTSQSEGQKAALTDLAALQAELTAGGAAALYDPATAQRLEVILATFPNCFTAKILKSATQRQIPSRYSLTGTCIRIEGAMAPFEKSIQEIRGGADIANYQLGRDNPLQAAKNNLAALKVKSDPRLTRVIDAEMALIDQFQRLLNANLKSSTVAGNYLAELRIAGERSDAEWQKLRDDKDLQDQLMQRGVSL